MSSAWLSLLLVATTVVLVESSHYYGSAMSWEHIGGDDETGNTRKVSLDSLFFHLVDTQPRVSLVLLTTGGERSSLLFNLHLKLFHWCTVKNQENA
jgi:hypothetical protein